VESQLPQNRAARDSVGHNSTLLIYRSEAFQPRENGRVSPPERCPRGGKAGGPRLLDRFPLHLEIHGGVAIGGSDTGVAEPVADGSDVDARTKQMYGCTVPPIPDPE